MCFIYILVITIINFSFFIHSFHYYSDPTQGYPNRHVSIYWFGLHAPNASDTTDYFWDDCTKPGWIEWKTSVNRQGYVPTTNCGFFDVYFQPFTTVLMKLWAMEQCNLKKYFICEDFIASKL